MPRIERTSRAATDAVEIWVYIAQDNVSAADDLIDQIEIRLATLSRMPLSAEAVPYIDPAVRRSSVGNYVITGCIKGADCAAYPGLLRGTFSPARRHAAACELYL